jgi:hypothetical protein
MTVIDFGLILLAWLTDASASINNSLTRSAPLLSPRRHEMLGSSSIANDSVSAGWGAASFGTIQSYLNGLCLDLPNGDTTNGNQLQIWNCNGHDNQKWRFFENQIRYLANTEKCVDAVLQGKTIVGPLQIWDCNGRPNQVFGYDANMRTIYLSRSNPKECIDIPDAKMAPGTMVQAWGCNGLPQQHWYAQVPEGQTSMTEMFNKAIARSAKGGPAYSGGDNRGLLVRNPFDDYEDSNRKAVPFSFIHNDIFAPTTIFPSGWNGMHGNGNPNCPNDGSNGFYKLNACGKDPNTGDTGPWNYATMAYILLDALDNNAVYKDWANVQSATWGNGVFYPTDSNSVDQRCMFNDHGPHANFYDCPGGYIDAGTGQFHADMGAQGAGGYPMGSGGGVGCHYDNAGTIDQTDAVHKKQNLVGSRWCECNYNFRGNWYAWVEQWVQHAWNKKSQDGWFNGGSVLAPSHALDQAACWMNNPRDMIDLQNVIYWKRTSWSNQRAPASKWDVSSLPTLRSYWGWNEVPVSMDVARNTALRSAVVIKLPAALCPFSAGGMDTIACLPYGHQTNLEGDIDVWVKNGILQLGLGNVAKRPGSYVVFAREWAEVGPGYAYANWQRWFYCETWISPTRKYQIKYAPPTPRSLPYGACYIDSCCFTPSPHFANSTKVYV